MRAAFAYLGKDEGGEDRLGKAPVGFSRSERAEPWGAVRDKPLSRAFQVRKHTDAVLGPMPLHPEDRLA